MSTYFVRSSTPVLESVGIPADLCTPCVVGMTESELWILGNSRVPDIVHVTRERPIPLQSLRNPTGGQTHARLRQPAEYAANLLQASTVVPPKAAPPVAYESTLIFVYSDAGAATLTALRIPPAPS